MTASRWTRPALIVVSATVLVVTVVAGAASPLRTTAAVWFLGVCPGLAVVAAIRLEDVWMEVTLALALSLSLDVVVAGVLAYAAGWSPGASLAILVAISLAGAAVEALRGPRRAGDPGRA